MILRLCKCCGPRVDAGAGALMSHSSDAMTVHRGRDGRRTRMTALLAGRWCDGKGGAAAAWGGGGGMANL